MLFARAALLGVLAPALLGDVFHHRHQPLGPAHGVEQHAALGLHPHVRALLAIQAAQIAALDDVTVADCLDAPTNLFTAVADAVPLVGAVASADDRLHRRAVVHAMLGAQLDVQQTQKVPHLGGRTHRGFAPPARQALLPSVHRAGRQRIVGMNLPKFGHRLAGLQPMRQVFRIPQIIADHQGNLAGDKIRLDLAGGLALAQHLVLPRFGMFCRGRRPFASRALMHRKIKAPRHKRQFARLR